MANDDQVGPIVNRLISQTVTGFELDQLNNVIADGTDVYHAMFAFDHESQAPYHSRVSPTRPR